MSLCLPFGTNSHQFACTWMLVLASHMTVKQNGCYFNHQTPIDRHLGSTWYGSAADSFEVLIMWESYLDTMILVSLAECASYHVVKSFQLVCHTVVWTLNPFFFYVKPNLFVKVWYICKILLSSLLEKPDINVVKIIHNFGLILSP